jgi:glycosyltransferase involved in cell wall biosynthesis
MSPEVSVVIPAYNAQETLGDTLASALGQSFENLEVIVVDDGSTDGTAEIARGIGDGRVRVLSVRNGGVARARNLGMGAARGALIAFLDADDLWRETKVARQVELLSSEPGVGMCVTAATRIDADGQAIGHIPVWRVADYTEALLLHSMIAGCISCGMVRRTVVDGVGGFDPAFSQSADWDLWLRLSLHTRFEALDDELVLYRTYAGNMSSDIALLERDTFAVLEKFFGNPAAEPYGPLRAHVYSNHWMTCSGSYLHAGQLGASLRCLARGVRDYPANVRRPLGVPWRWIARVTSPSPDPV